MPKDAAYYRAYRQANRTRIRDQDRKRIRAERPTKPLKPFVGIDGEGGNIGNRHEYLLLRAGDQTLYTGKPLTPEECLRFLCSLNPDVIYVGFFFDYDVTMMLRDIPGERVGRLLDKDARHQEGYRQPLPLDYGPYQIEYTPHKEFAVRRGRNSKWIRVSDVGSFFQCSFVKALDQWQIGTAEQRAAIAEGKEKRSNFEELTEETDAYNALEIELLNELMERFREVCQDVGYVPSRWQGPGWIASRMMERHNVPKTKDVELPPAVVDAAQNAYYGGRFETTAIGHVPGPVYQYDINSAYPHALTQLPCLLHGAWTHGPMSAGGGISLHRIRFDAIEPANLYAFPIRAKDGSISFPASGQGWYWSVELNQAWHQDWAVLDQWTYATDCDCQPFGFIPNVYAERIALGKTARGTVLKLALNSLYGKTCQSIGTAPYANPVWAGLITATTRAKLAQLAHQGEDCCNDAYMLATDGLFCGPRPTVVPDKELGGWDLDIHDNLFIIQPGLYFTPDHQMPKTRGVPRQIIVQYRQAFLDAYQEGALSGQLGSVTVPIRNFIGLRIANARGKPETAGAWIDSTREVTFDVSTKRHAPMLREGVLRTSPLDGGLETVPYSKDIGNYLANLRLQWDDHPDWADKLYGDEL